MQVTNWSEAMHVCMNVIDRLCGIAYNNNKCDDLNVGIYT